MDKQKLEEYIKQGLTIVKICEIESISRHAYHQLMKLHGLVTKFKQQNPDAKMGRPSKVGEKLEHYIGEKHGRLTITGIITKIKKNGKPQYLSECKCSCGKVVHRDRYKMIKSKNPSCGCQKAEIWSMIGTLYGSKNSRNYKVKNWYFLKDGQKVKCRSSYEVIYANYLTDNEIEFEYEPRAFHLSNNRQYTPDFYLKRENLYVELKGMENPRQEPNRAAFIEDGYKLKVMKWEDLRDECKIPYRSYSGFRKSSLKFPGGMEEYYGQFAYKNVVVKKRAYNSFTLGSSDCNSKLQELSTSP